jgi:hypothetical protein
MVDVKIVNSDQKLKRRVAYLNAAGERVEEDLDALLVFRATGTVVAFPSGQPITPAATAGAAVPIEIIFFLKDNGLLTKTIHRGPEGRSLLILVSAAWGAANWNGQSKATGEGWLKGWKTSPKIPPSHLDAYARASPTRFSSPPKTMRIARGLASRPGSATISSMCRESRPSP